jgi:hypothetical protein
MVECVSRFHYVLRSLVVSYSKPCTGGEGQKGDIENIFAIAITI